MRRGHTRLALPAVALLLSVACTSNQREAEPQPAQPVADQQAPASGTEAAVVPQQPDGAGTASGVAPGQATRPSQSATTAPAARPAPGRSGSIAPAAPQPPRPPAPAERSDASARAEASDAEAAAREAGTSAREAARDVPRPEPARMISIPAETRLPLALQTAVASDTSNVEDRVAARVTSDVVVDDEVVIPEGSRVDGRVTYAQPSGKVKGRAGLTVRFHSLTVGSRTYDIATEPVRREAAGTKAKDARNIGIGAGAGAVIGGIIGGRKGAGVGAAVGGAGGTGMVLATKGEEVRMPAGTSVTTRFAEPLVVEARRSGTR